MMIPFDVGTIAALVLMPALFLLIWVRMAPLMRAEELALERGLHLRLWFDLLVLGLMSIAMVIAIALNGSR
jgi:hypothetical protein